MHRAKCRVILTLSFSRNEFYQRNSPKQRTESSCKMPHKKKIKKMKNIFQNRFRFHPCFSPISEGTIRDGHRCVPLEPYRERMLRNMYKSIKAAVSARQAAESFGIAVNRSGMATCPFHEDHTPSLKLDQRYYCFGCGATGDVIDFTARLLNVSNYNAA